MKKVLLTIFVLALLGGEALAANGRPANCPARRWCGCWLASHLSMPSRPLWVARAWARIGHPAGGPQVGAVVVWRHHVGLITAVEGGMIRVLSGNDGGAVRDRWRSTRGVIAYRIINQFSFVQN